MCSQLRAYLEEKIKALELVVGENQSLQNQLEQMAVKVKNSEAENKMLVDRWMLQKVQDAERLNEVLHIISIIKMKVWKRFNWSTDLLFNLLLLMFSSFFRVTLD